jgi:acyl-CoA thioester hydrolase
MDDGSVEFRVRYAETDQMGVVYHANYLVWCEIGRTELMRRLGLPYAEMERQGVRLAVSEASLRFGGPARYDDLIRVDTRVLAVRSRSVTFGYVISRAAEGGATALVSARTTLIATGDGGVTRSLPGALLQTLRSAGE